LPVSCQPLDPGHTKVTVVTKRRLSINAFTTLREKTFHKMFAQAVDIVNGGGELPEKAPPDQASPHRKTTKTR